MKIVLVKDQTAFCSSLVLIYSGLMVITTVESAPTINHSDNNNNSDNNKSSSRQLNSNQLTAFENIVRKEEIPRDEQILFFLQCFVLNRITASTFVHIFDIIPLFTAELEEPKIGI